MTQPTYIYGLFDPLNNELRYVGKTNNIKKRISRHINEKGITHKICWIKSLKKSKQTPIIEIIDKVYSDWKFWEKWYISYFRSIGCRLTNMTDGGENPPSSSGRTPWNKIENKDPRLENFITTIKETNKNNKYWVGRKHTEYSIQKISNNNKGRIPWNKGRRGLNSGSKNYFYRKRHSNESKELMSLKNHNKKLSDNDVVNVYNKYWNDNIKQKELAELYSVNSSVISRIVSRKNKRYENSLKRLGYDAK